jgi:hypothetical protein
MVWSIAALYNDVQNRYLAFCEYTLSEHSLLRFNSAALSYDILLNPRSLLYYSAFRILTSTNKPIRTGTYSDKLIGQKWVWQLKKSFSSPVQVHQLFYPALDSTVHSTYEVFPRGMDLCDLYKNISFHQLSSKQGPRY